MAFLFKIKFLLMVANYGQYHKKHHIGGYYQYAK